jgi:hypothetical protein
LSLKASFCIKIVKYLGNVLAQASKILTLTPGLLSLQARYVMKYDHNGGALVVKVTDDVVCLQFKSDAAQVPILSTSVRVTSREARWYIFKQKIPICVFFGGPYRKMLVYFIAIWNKLRPFGKGNYGSLVI